MKKTNPYDDELEEEVIEEEYRGRKIFCSCEEDPRFCEVHSNWG
jgi:hypothetical protein